MEFIKDFNRKKTKEQQSDDSKIIRQKYPDRVPVIVDRFRSTDPQLDKNKYLVPLDLTMGQFLTVIRRRLTKKLDSMENLFFFVNNTMVPVSEMLSSVYKTHAQNGYLVITYSLEQTFG